jgi:Ser/Thr protein kinase RdoA (MazF antagonist)
MPGMGDHVTGELSPEETHYWDGEPVGWQPLWLTPDAVLQAVRQLYDLPVTAAYYLPAGLLNQSWRVTTGEQTWVLRVARPERSREQISYEHASIRAFREHLRFVAPPVPTRDGQTVADWKSRLLSLFPFVSGVAGTAVDPDVRSERAAVALAQIHQVSVDRIRLPQRPGHRSVDEHPRWIWSNVRPVLIRDLAGTDDFDVLVETFDHEMAALDTWLDTLRASGRPLRRALIHGDFNPRNLIFDDSTGGERSIRAVIDWDECHVDLLAWEVAQVAFGDNLVSPRTFWTTYLEAGGQLPPEDVDLLAGFRRVGMFSEVQWTVDGGRTNPRALAILRDVASTLARLRHRETDLT